MPPAELVIRILAGGFAVVFFSLIGITLKPKSLAGVFAAAPSVAIVGIALAAAHHPPQVVSADARAMVAGAIAFFGYLILVRWLVRERRWHALAAASTALAGWFVIVAILYPFISRASL